MSLISALINKTEIPFFAKSDKNFSEELLFLQKLEDSCRKKLRLTNEFLSEWDKAEGLQRNKLAYDSIEYNREWKLAA